MAIDINFGLYNTSAVSFFIFRIFDYYRRTGKVCLSVCLFVCLIFCCIDPPKKEKEFNDTTLPFGSYNDFFFLIVHLKVNQLLLTWTCFVSFSSSDRIYQ